METPYRKYCNKALTAYIRTYSLFKSGRLNINIKLALYKALIGSIMVHACPTWEYATDAHFLKLQRLQNGVLRATGNFDKHTPVREVHMVLKITYVYDFFLWRYSPHLGLGLPP
jgi:hypothetical protein